MPIRELTASDEVFPGSEAKGSARPIQASREAERAAPVVDDLARRIGPRSFSRVGRDATPSAGTKRPAPANGAKIRRRFALSLAPACLAALTLGAAACATAKCPCAEPAQGATMGAAMPHGNAELEALFNREWDYQMRDDPEYASFLGDRRYNRDWRDDSPNAYAARKAHADEVLAALARIDRSALTGADRENYDVFRIHLEYARDRLALGFQYLLLNQLDGVQTANQLADALPFEKAADYEDWLARLSNFPARVTQTIALLREAIAKKLVHPRVVMARITAQLDRQIVASSEASPFYQPFRNMPAAIPEATRDKLRADARRAITNDVVPAFRTFKTFFVGEYLPATTPAVGAWQWPNGAEIYRLACRAHTTTELSPEQIHDIGLAEVKRVHDEMMTIKKQVGFAGDLSHFFAFLRSDPKFYYRSPEELFDGYAAVTKRIEPRLVRVFHTLPRTPFGLEAIPDNIAPETTTAYYREPAADGTRAGTYFVNLFKPDARPKWEMMALSLHESVPGHHLQIALATEQANIPKFRRHADFTSFVEGWALYAESLGEDMALYDDPYAKFGELTYDMWRSVRLVIDTGMHFKHWDRDRAIAYFRENAPKQELDIVNEVDRYIVWPGQALAYKVGQLKFLELRQRARQKLGARFDIGAFHDVALRSGAVPLSVLERNVDAWIAERSASAGGS